LRYLKGNHLVSGKKEMLIKRINRQKICTRWR